MEWIWHGSDLAPYEVSVKPTVVHIWSVIFYLYFRKHTNTHTHTWIVENAKMGCNIKQNKIRQRCMCVHCTHRLFSMSNSLAHHTHWLYSSDFDILDTHSPPKFANNKNIHEFCTLSHWTVEQRTTSTKTTMSLSLLLAIAKGKYEKDLSLLLTLIIFTINVAVSYLYQYRVYRVQST